MMEMACLALIVPETAWRRTASYYVQPELALASTGPYPKINPKLPDDDFDAAVRIAQAEFDQHHPDVVVGSSRGGAVAMNLKIDVPLVLLCPAWKRFATARTVKPSTTVLHSKADEVVPFLDSVELVQNSGLPESALIVVGTDHRLADPESLKAMAEACEKAVTIQKGEGYVCGTCGKFHAELPMEFGTDAPLLYETIPADERESRCDITSDLCVVDEKHFFIRGCLVIPVLDGNGPFVWSVWSSLSKENFKRTVELWGTDGRETEPPYFGWLSTRLPLYPETLSLKTNVHTRPVGQRPFIELEPTDHLLAVEQRNGIAMARVREIAAKLLHGTRE